MDEPIRDFASPEMFTLIVGPRSDPLYVPRSILEQIPFFAIALKDDKYKEAKEKVFTFSEESDDPQIFATVLRSVIADYIREIDDEEVAETYVKSFMLADRLMAERTANIICERFVDYYYKGRRIEPEFLGMLSEAGLQESRLYDFFTKAIGLNLFVVQNSWNSQARPSLFEERKEALAKLSTDDLIAVMSHVPDIERSSPMQISGLHPDGRYYCAVHTHQYTTECFPRPETQENPYPSRTDSIYPRAYDPYP